MTSGLNSRCIASQPLHKRNPYRPLRMTLRLNIRTAVAILREIFGLIALFCCLAALSAPAATRTSHHFDHAEAPVAAGEFHTHAQDPTPETDTSRDVPTPNEGTAGHSHMPSSAYDLGFLATYEMQPHSLSSNDTLAAAHTPVLGTLGWSPPVRPPRTA